MYPTKPIITFLPDSVGDTFYAEDFFRYLLREKIAPLPRKKYRVMPQVISVSEAEKIFTHSNLSKIKAMGLLTFVKRGETYILKDNLWDALYEYWRLINVKTIKLKHCKAA